MLYLLQILKVASDEWKRFICFGCHLLNVIVPF
jgi:hypothetical protein